MQVRVVAAKAKARVGKQKVYKFADEVANAIMTHSSIRNSMRT